MQLLPDPLPLVLFVLAGCAPGALAVPAPWIALDIDEIALLDAAPNASTIGSFEITNTGTQAAVVRLTTDPPFASLTATVEIPAGASAIASIRFDAVSYEPAAGVILLDAGYGSIELAVYATVDLDVDDDGYSSLDAGGDDCDDEDASVHPGLVEVCDGRDNDCSGVVDDVPDPPTWWPDADEDGYGDASADPVASCDRPAVGWVSNGTDCDDLRGDVHPGAVETWYDGVDQDCDGASDYDRDGDGYDSEGFGGDDCADSNAAVNPGATEVADGLDNDCDGLTT